MLTSVVEPAVLFYHCTGYSSVQPEYVGSGVRDVLDGLQSQRIGNGVHKYGSAGRCQRSCLTADVQFFLVLLDARLL